MKKIDIIIIGSILVLASIVYAFITIFKEPGASVVVRINGEEVAQYSLLVDGEYELNGGTNILHIEDGKAWLVDATCPDKLCVNQGKIDSNGETITCLPNKLTITVISAEDDFVELS